MAMNDKSFLGTGWGFPPTFVRGTNTVELVSDEEDIKESLRIILSTKIGERVMNPTFGSDTDRLMFEPINESLISLVQEIVRNSILFFEPRIQAEDVRIVTDQQTEGLLQIEVDFSIKATNARANIVFPFFINEGTDIVQ